MRVGVVSDTHMPGAGSELPKRVIEGLTGVDLIIHAGDWTMPEVYEQFHSIAPVEGVTGNVDSPKMSELLGTEKILNLNGYRIGVVHGHRGNGRTTPQRARNTFRDEETDLIIFGHSHIPFDEVIDDVRVFNPGSPTDKRRQPRFSFAIMTLGETLEVEPIYFDKK
ncbi:MAG TPA: metallophosphoesterase family protein [Bacillales bacterium]|nr:metallophosphoesterase family protein [Bacillales bacterium]